MPELREHASALRVDSARDFLPAGDLLSEYIPGTLTSRPVIEIEVASEMTSPPSDARWCNI